MTDFGKVIEALAVLLWPIIVVILILMFRPAVRAIIRSAESRKFTIKIGGQELTMEEANQQQSAVIADIRSQLLELKRRIEGDTETGQTQAEPTSPQKRTVLWVDDTPRDNIYFVQQLSDAGFSVDLALSTSDALQRFYGGQYSLIISDMGRKEQGSFEPTAGLDLFKRIHSERPDVPFVILTRSRNVSKYASEAKALGVTLITSSPTELFGMLLKLAR